MKLVDVPRDATSGMKKTQLGEFAVYYRLAKPAESDETTIDVIVAAHDRFLRIAEPLPLEGSDQLAAPRIALAVSDSNNPVILLELSTTEHFIERRLALLIDLRGEPRATSIEGEQVSGHGACGGPDAVFEPHSSMSCQWDNGRKDFVCRQARYLKRDWGMRTSWRSFTLLAARRSPARRT